MELKLRVRVRVRVRGGARDEMRMNLNQGRESEVQFSRRSTRRIQYESTKMKGKN